MVFVLQKCNYKNAVYYEIDVKSIYRPFSVYKNRRLAKFLKNY